MDGRTARAAVAARGEAMVPQVAAATTTARVEAAGLGARREAVALEAVLAHRVARDPQEAQARQAARALQEAQAPLEARVRPEVQVAGEATAAAEAVVAAAAV